jgi:hypothetical protein
MKQSRLPQIFHRLVQRLALSDYRQVQALGYVATLIAWINHGLDDVPMMIHGCLLPFQSLFKFGNVSDLGGNLQEAPQPLRVGNG